MDIQEIHHHEWRDLPRRDMKLCEGCDTRLMQSPTWGWVRYECLPELWEKPRAELLATIDQLAARIVELEGALIVTGAVMHHTLAHIGEPRLCQRYACEPWTKVARARYGSEPNPLYAEMLARKEATDAR